MPCGVLCLIYKRKRFQCFQKTNGKRPLRVKMFARKFRERDTDDHLEEMIGKGRMPCNTMQHNFCIEVGILAKSLP